MSFSTLEYDDLLGLGRLDMVGLRKLFAFDDVDELMNNVDAGHGGGEGGDSDSDQDGGCGGDE